MEDLIIEILYQDNDLVIVNKPAHLLIHPSKELRGEDNRTLLKVLAKQIDRYIYPIHRLDRPVSGLIVFGLSKNSTRMLSESWTTSRVQKFYIGLARGQYEESGKLDFQLSDHNKVKKDALTLYRPLSVFKNSTLLEIEIRTGRHHQIRRHFARTVNHLLGDRTYGKKKYNDESLNDHGLERIFLHSSKLIFEHPTQLKKIEVKCPLPDDLRQVLKSMINEQNKNPSEGFENIINLDEI
jgi:tRNA pseudouridine65 synthase